MKIKSIESSIANEKDEECIYYIDFWEMLFSQTQWIGMVFLYQKPLDRSIYKFNFLVAY